ncbi:PREDICTED: SHC-transforming protein 1 isoform X2 [Gavialis gangeticus]|uniref:SHC-transforming protein 1 isoform X2 n=1 Tax=Gavialis gangeticus TaxID=94835 RepID=UPI00092FCEF4|nr:PREDICTED: SHC-transforming protein 1 isoform X2 [Gavialis gangeticus]
MRFPAPPVSQRTAVSPEAGQGRPGRAAGAMPAEAGQAGPSPGEQEGRGAVPGPPGPWTGRCWLIPCLLLNAGGTLGGQGLLVPAACVGPGPATEMEYVDMNKLSCGKKTRVEGGQLGGDEWTRHGSFVNKPTRGWLHPDDKVMGPGVSYLVRYMGCVEVLQSMRALDFNTRTQVTREAISLVCEAVPGAKGAVRRRKPCGRSLNSILGKSNLKFAGMPITLTISTSSLNLMASDCKQIIANHHMQSISFASGGDPDTAEYVAYVAKDPVNQRACHILECPEGLAQDVISTIGQAFELRFKQYLKNPPKLVTPHDRMAGFDGSAWDEEEEEATDHQYYNDFPGKEPPIGGLVDMRLRDGAGAALTPNHLGATLPVGQVSGGNHETRKQHPPAQGREKLPALAGGPGRPDLFDDPSYVNVQNLDKVRQASTTGLPGTSNGSTQRDLFDMKPFEDALRVPPPVPMGLPPAQVVASMEEQLQREPWYHGKMNRKEAEKLLKVNGDFLVRESTTTPGQYVLTGLQGGQPKHLLLVDPEGVVRTKDHRFESVSHLISYHMDNHLPIISAGSEMCLQQPVERRL